MATDILRSVKYVTFKEWSGLVLTVVGLLLIPVGWAFSRAVWLVGFGLLALGLWMFYTLRICRRERKLEEGVGHQQTVGDSPTDIHNYSGWQHGGRSQTMDTRSEPVEVDDAEA